MFSHFIGSIISKTDMQSYIPEWREPVKVNLRENTTLYGSSPPGSGALLAFMMAVLDGYDDMDKSAVEDKEKAALAYHRIIETLKFAYAYRSQMEDSNSKEMQEVYIRISKYSLKLHKFFLKLVNVH